MFPVLQDAENEYQILSLSSSAHFTSYNMSLFKDLSLKSRIVLMLWSSALNMRRTSLDFLANSSEKLGQETQQSNIDEGFPPLPFSNPTHSVSAKSEKSPPFLFVNELNKETSHSKSSYEFAVRSHVRKRVMLDERRQNATIRRLRQLL